MTNIEDVRELRNHQNPMPALGAFLEPLDENCARGRYCYCVRVIRQFPPRESSSNAGIECERWGMRDGKPFDDGCVQRGSYLHVRVASDGLWRDAYERADGYRCTPLFWREMTVDQDGQSALF